jgi:hypothetical protein
MCNCTGKNNRYMTCGIVRTSAKNDDELAQKVQIVYYMK